MEYIGICHTSSAVMCICFRLHFTAVDVCEVKYFDHKNTFRWFIL